MESGLFCFLGDYILGMSAPSVVSAIQIGIVDDDASVGRALARLLRGHGYECVIFESGEAALAAPDLHGIHCLIVDIQLRGMDGFEFCGKLDAAGVYIPHIFITAYIHPERSVTPDPLGDDILLIKPIDEFDLLASIERAMGESGK
jgi:FixJ family two-component response regulator